MDLGRGGAPALRAAAPAALLALLTVATPAGAATVSVEGSVLRVTAAAGEANEVAVTASAASFIVTDAGAQLTPGPGCASTGTGVACVLSLIHI